MPDELHLPARLTRDARLVRGERALLRSVDDALAALAEASGRELRQAGMDASILDSRHPEWQAAIDGTIIPAVRDLFTVGWTQETRLDDIGLADSYADAHLRSVRNRMVGVSDEVFRQITASLAEGRQATFTDATTGEVHVGESIPQLAARVDAVLSDTETWRNRAVTVARTETIAANNAGAHAAAAVNAQVLGVGDNDVVKEWLATTDSRTRPTHAEANGEQVTGMSALFSIGDAALAYPGDPGGPADEVINCRCTTLYHYPGDPNYPADATPAPAAPPPEPSPTPSYAQPGDPAPEPQFVDRIHSDLSAGNITADQIRQIVSGKSRLAQVNVETAIARHEAEQAAASAVTAETAAERAGITARRSTPQEVYDALTPRRGGWNTTTRAKALAELRTTAEGRQLARTIDSFQSGGSTAIPRLRTDIEKYLTGGDLTPGRQDAVENLLSAIGNGPDPARSLWRGMTIPGDVDTVLARYATGSDVDLSLASFSSDKSAAQGFMEGGAGQKIRVKATTPVLVEWTGTKHALPIERMSKSGVFANEKEWLAAGRYKVVGARKVTRAGKTTVVVQIEQVGAW